MRENAKTVYVGHLGKDARNDECSALLMKWDGYGNSGIKERVVKRIKYRGLLRKFEKHDKSISKVSTKLTEAQLRRF